VNERTDDLPCGAAARVYTSVRHRVATVTMRDHVIGWVQAGTKVLAGSDAERRYAPGELFLAAQGTQWDVINATGPEGRYVAQLLTVPNVLLKWFVERYPQPSTIKPVRGQQGLRIDRELAEAIERAAGTLGDASASRPLQLHRLCEVLLLLAERGWCFEPTDEGWDDRVRRLVGHRLHARWSLDELAAAFHTSPSTLRRRLAERGTTLSDLLREARLEAALGLLQTTELSVGEIALRCGYESHSRFSSAFRQRYGFAPSHLRPGAGPNAMSAVAQHLALAG
jgi:AraC-like DNA-binding protein